MQYVADLHLHSKYSRAVSPQMTLPLMADYARVKGIDILTASDFTHPLWFKEICNQLEEAEEGLYKLKNQNSNLKNTDQNSKIKKDVLFLLSTEISSIYKQGEKLRRIHSLVFVPNISTVEKINKALLSRGCNLNADGRPIIGLSSKNLLELILNIDEKCFLIPCHVWTPHFGLYGSASGFNSINEAFGDSAKYIYGVETGLSSDPVMNWSMKELHHRSILSFSDAHSLIKMGREATVFVTKYPDSKEDFVLTYNELRLAIMQKSDKLTIGYTIEFFPEEGKYHFSGHRNCKISIDPSQNDENNLICSVCRKRLTEGVLVRVKQLAESALQNRMKIILNKKGLGWYVDTLRIKPPYVKIVPLIEIVAEALNSTVASQKVKEMYFKLCNKFNNEIEVLLKADENEIAIIGGDRIAEGVRKVRSGDIFISPGYDGDYGKVKIWSVGKDTQQTKSAKSQLSLDF